MPIAIFTIPVTNVDDVIEHYNKIRIYRSTGLITGPFVEISAPGTRPTLEPDVTAYQFTDPTALGDYYYQTTFHNSVTGDESPPSDPILGSVLSGSQPLLDPALDIMTVEELKELYLFGVDLTDDNGRPMPDFLHAHYIQAAVGWVEAKLDIVLSPRQVTDQLDYFETDYASYVYLKLDSIPVQSVSRVAVVIPGNTTPQTVISFPVPTIRLGIPEAGQVNIYPGANTMMQLFQGGFAMGLAGSGLFGAGFAPAVFEIDYLAGFPRGRVPAIIKDVIGKVASFGPLNISGDLVGGAGIQGESISIDGLSQSITTTNSSTNAGFGARLLQYMKELKDILPQLRRSYHPTGMVVA